MKRLIILLLTLFWANLFAQKRITITADIENLNSDTTGISISRMIPAVALPKIRPMINIKGGRMEISVDSRDPVLFLLGKLTGKTFFILEPGDSVHIQSKASHPVFSGRSSNKMNLCRQLFELDTLVKRIPVKKYKSRILNAFFERFNFSSELIEQRLKLIETYRAQLSDRYYDMIRAWAVSKAEKNTYIQFYDVVYARKEAELSSQDLCQIYDSTLVKSPFRKIKANESTSSTNYFDWYASMLVTSEYYRSRSFSDDVIDEPDTLKISSLYHFAKLKYSGAQRSYILAKIIMAKSFSAYSKTIITYPMREPLIKDYLSNINYPAYKDAMREYLSEMDRLGKGKTAPEIGLPDEKGKLLTLADLKGSVVFVDFWFTGCVGCLILAPKVKAAEQQLHGDNRFKFVSICIDADRSKWLASVKAGKYTTNTGINLYTAGKGSSHPILDQYHARSFPTTVIIDATGQITTFNPVLPDAQKIVELMRQAASR